MEQPMVRMMALWLDLLRGYNLVAQLGTNSVAEMDYWREPLTVILKVGWKGIEMVDLRECLLVVMSVVLTVILKASKRVDSLGKMLVVLWVNIMAAE